MLNGTISATLPGGRMCEICIYREGMDNKLKFVETKGRFLCLQCAALVERPIDPQVLMSEFEEALKEAKTAEYDAILAFSGGKDSAVALKLLVERGLKVLAFTVDQGMKNVKTRANINSIIDFLKVDWLLIHSYPYKAFREMIIQGSSVCGQTCKTAWKLPVFRTVAQRYGAKAIFTGGDTPKNWSCIDQKDPTFIRVVAAYSLTKRDIERAIAELPWEDPGVGPYDSDCLMASYGIYNILLRNGGHAPRILIDYIAERIRFGLLDREEELEKLTRIPILSREDQKQVENLLELRNDLVKNREMGDD